MTYWRKRKERSGRVSLWKPLEMDDTQVMLELAKFAQPPHKGGDPLTLGRRRVRAQVPNNRQPSRLLRVRRKRPRRHGAADERDELAPFHSITSSARASSVDGTSRPIARAVLRLTTNSCLVGNCAGSSPGFAPLRMRSTYDAPCRNGSIGFGP